MTGEYGDDVFAQALFILAERALSRPVPPAAATYLTSLQMADGGWEFCCGFGTDTNTTAIVVRALVAAGKPSTDPALTSAIVYLHANQAADGGFPYSVPFESDANSTAYVIQAIIALGQSAEAGGPWALGGGANPLAKLLSFQNPATGALVAFGADSPFATYQGIPGLLLEAFPEQEEPDEYTATPTFTSTSTATATFTPTRTSMPTTATHTPARTATSSTATGIATTATPSVVNAVLASTSQPTQVGTVSGLPQTGSGPIAGSDKVATAALASSGAFLFAAGVVTARRRRVR